MRRTPNGLAIFAGRALVALFLLCSTASAAAEVRFDGAYQFRVGFNSNYLLDPDQRLNQTGYAEHRLRLTPKIVEQTSIEIQAQFDVVSGLIAGDYAPSFGNLGWTERSEHNGVNARGFDFRYLFATIRLPVGLLQLGQMPNHWGMGLVANSGEGMDATDFGDLRFGDIVDGFLFGFRPLTWLGPRSTLATQVVAGVAGHLIYRDRYASLVTRSGGGLAFSDVALQGVAFARWEPSELTRIGFYAARRSQTFANDGGNLHVWVYDVHARTELVFPSISTSLRLEAEGAEVYGGSTHLGNAASNSVQVAQQGLVARATITHDEFELEVEGGYASGDSNPFDDAATGFATSRDYKVGLVLWDELMLFQTQNGARRLGDPNLSGRPAGAVDLIPTEGAITNALYLNPRIRYKPGWFGGKLRAVAGAIFTRAPEPVADPYQTFLASAPRNVFGAAAGKSYGTELDFSLAWRTAFTQDRQVGLEVGAQYGVLFPGDVFAKLDGSSLGPVHAFKFRTTLFF